MKITPKKLRDRRFKGLLREQREIPPTKKSSKQLFDPSTPKKKDEDCGSPHLSSKEICT